MKMVRYFLILVTFFTFSGAAGAGASDKYHAITLEGWKVYIEQSLVDKNDPRVFKALRILRNKLSDVKNVMPNQYISQLQDVPLWLSRNNGDNVEYYFFETRVYRGGISPKMLGGIEFQNIDHFLEMIEIMPGLVIHEFAHAYHKNNYNKIDKAIMRAFNNSQTEKLYKQTSSKRNHRGSAVYASTNAFEYFADLTAMYYGVNEYYPYNRADLKKYDSVGYEMIEEVWQ
jgi:hypothetical protein